MFRRILATAVVIIWTGSAIADDVRIIEPRPFGYFLGDTLTRTFEIDRKDGETIVAATLPPTGQAAYWLEIRKVDSASSGALHRISIDYQIFYAAIDPRKLEIPGYTIALQAGDVQRTVPIPPMAVTVSPLREIFPDQERAKEANLLRPDVVPRLAPLNPVRSAAIGSAALALAGLLLLARHRAWGPFRQVAARPFTRAQYEIARLFKHHPEHEAYSRALTVLHRAFDERAGRRVLADDVPQYLADHREYSNLQETIEDFFEASRAVFFAGDDMGAAAALPPSKLTELAGELARRERAVR
jgi:mxaA protein